MPGGHFRRRTSQNSVMRKLNFGDNPFQRLSGKSLCGSDGASFGGTKSRKGARSHRCAVSWYPVVDPIRSFQTVSLRTSVNKGKGKGRARYTPALCFLRVFT